MDLREIATRDGVVVDVLTRLDRDMWGRDWDRWYGRWWDGAWRVLRHYITFIGGPKYDGVLGWFDWHDLGIVLCAWVRDELGYPELGRELETFKEVAKRCAWEMYAAPRLLGIFL